MTQVRNIGGTVGANGSAEVRGLAGWLLGKLGGLRGERSGQRRQMHLVETLPLGGKRQLMLVECGGERFLVGGGLDSVETIVRVRAAANAAEMVETPGGICR